MERNTEVEEYRSKYLIKPIKTSAFKQLMSLHWAMFYCYVILFIGGASMARLPTDAIYRSERYDFHEALGTLVIALLTLRILVLLRVWWKKYTRRSPLFTREWWKKVALHSSLYLLMWVVPVTGVFLSNSYEANNIKVLGVVLPDIFPQNSQMVDLGRGLHFWFSYVFLAFAILHIIEQKKVVKAFWRRFQIKLK